jgi:hypothetical protein
MPDKNQSNSSISVSSPLEKIRVSIATFFNRLSQSFQLQECEQVVKIQQISMPSNCLHRLC